MNYVLFLFPEVRHVQAYRSRSCGAGIAGAVHRNDRHLDAGPGKFVRPHATPLSPSCPAFGTGSRTAGQILWRGSTPWCCSPVLGGGGGEPRPDQGRPPEKRGKRGPVRPAGGGKGG